MKIGDLLPKAKAKSKRTQRLAKPPVPKPIRKPVAPLPPIALPRELKSRLIALRRRYRSVVGATGFFMLIGALSGLLLAQGLSDWWFDLPWLARAVFLLTDIVLLGTIYQRYLHRPLQKKLGMPETALLVEKKWPKLMQSVITAVEMAEGKPGATRGSPQLVDIVMQQARARTTGLNFSDVVSTRPLRRWAIWGSVATLGALTLAWSAWPSSLALLERIFLLNVPLPTKTIVVAITKDMTVPISSDVELSARAQGIIPTHGRVTITYDEGAPQEFSLTAQTEQPDTFSFTVHNVQKAFKYHFTLNDGHGAEFTVTAKVPPSLASVDCTQVFPDYTGLPPQDVPSTGLSLLAGGHLKVKAKATEALKSATVIEQIAEGATKSIPMTLDATTQQMEADIPIPAKDLTGFSIHLIDADGVASANETVYPIDLVPDKPPVVKITQPTGQNETITLRAKPVILFDASDDYGLTKLTLNFEMLPPMIAGSESAPKPPIQQIPIKIKAAKEGTHYEYDLDVSAQSPAWHEGWTVSYWIEATDNNTATGPGVTRTDKQQFGVLTPEAKQAEIMERLKQNAADIDTLSDTQEKVSHDVGDTIPQK